MKSKYKFGTPTISDKNLSSFIKPLIKAVCIGIEIEMQAKEMNQESGNIQYICCHHIGDTAMLRGKYGLFKK